MGSRVLQSFVRNGLCMLCTLRGRAQTDCELAALLADSFDNVIVHAALVARALCVSWFDLIIMPRALGVARDGMHRYLCRVSWIEEDGSFPETFERLTRPDFKLYVWRCAGCK
jgi:hypothetical protein